tara:strand:- start:209 stop:481 length:273 start_codon:yes stop_codon:yes gene_type:complete
MDKNFDNFIDKKAKQLPNRRYEVRYPQNVSIIIDLLEICVKKKKTTQNHFLYSYRSIAEYMYDVLEHREATKEGLRRAISRIAKEHNLEL